MKKYSVLLSVLLFVFAFGGVLNAVSIESSSLLPENNSFLNYTGVAFIFNATDDYNDTLNCSLYLNGAINATNESVANSTVTNFTVDLSDGNYIWYINCTNGTDNAISEIRNLTIDTQPVVVNGILSSPDFFVSNMSPNNILTIYVNASDNGSGIKFITANFTELSQSGLDYVNLTYNSTTGLWNVSVEITDVSNFEFTPLNISFFAKDNAGNGYVGQNYTTVILYNVSNYPINHSCFQWGPSMTDLRTIPDFNSANYVIDVQMNVSCLLGGVLPGSPAWMSDYETVALLNFSSINMSDSGIGLKLASLFQNIQVNITLPNQFGDSRIYLNSTALSEFNTTTLIKLFHLPFTSEPEIEEDVGAAGYNDSSIDWVQGLGEGNLTFTVYGFSGYNITDNASPIITLNSPLNGSVTNDTTPTINITLNGTKTPISYVLVQIDSTQYIYNSTVNQTNCQSTSDPEIMECVFDSTELSEGVHNLTIFVKDFGGDVGNNATSINNFVVNVSAPQLIITSPLNNSIVNSTTVLVTGNSSDTYLNFTNITIYNSTDDLINYTITTNSTWSVRFVVSENGFYKILAKAYNMIGNVNISEINITVNDTTAPVVTAKSATSSGSTVTLSVTTDEYAICRYATSDIDYENMSNMTTTGELTHSKAFTFSSSSSGTYYVRCADNVNNTMNSSNSTAYSITISSSSSSSSTSTTNVTTTLPPVPPQPTTQPTAEEQPSPVVPVSVVSSQPSTVTFQINTAANEPVVIDVPKMAAGVAQTTGISKISIVTKTGLSNVQVSIKPVEKPAEIQNPDKKVLNYIEINFGVSNENIQSAKITFSLKKSDIRKQNIDSGTIKLLRYANGQWQELETKLGFEDLDTLTFEATTPGFSYFAIAGNEIQAPAEQPKVTTTTTEEGEEALILPAPEKKEESPLGLIILILIIAAVAYLYFTSKQKPWSKR